MTIKDATLENFNELKNNGLVLLDFWAPWCGPCKMIHPVLDDIEAELGDKLTIVKVNIDEEGELAQKEGVMSIPTLRILKDGELKDELMGYHPKETITEKINYYF